MLRDTKRPLYILGTLFILALIAVLQGLSPSIFLLPVPLFGVFSLTFLFFSMRIGFSRTVEFFIFSLTGIRKSATPYLSTKWVFYSASLTALTALFQIGLHLSEPAILGACIGTVLASYFYAFLLAALLPLEQKSDPAAAIPVSTFFPKAATEPLPEPEVQPEQESLVELERRAKSARLRGVAGSSAYEFAQQVLANIQIAASKFPRIENALRLKHDELELVIICSAMHLEAESHIGRCHSHKAINSKLTAKIGELGDDVFDIHTELVNYCSEYSSIKIDFEPHLLFILHIARRILPINSSFEKSISKILQDSQQLTEAHLKKNRAI